MVNDRIYWFIDGIPIKKNHAIVAAAHMKGLTGITVTWRPATSENVISSRNGWSLECDQVKMVFRGGVETVVRKIESWQNTNGGLLF